MLRSPAIHFPPTLTDHGLNRVPQEGKCGYLHITGGVYRVGLAVQ